LRLHFLKLEKVKGAKMAEKNKKDLNHEMFTNKDGYVEGGVEVEMTDPSEMQEQEVQGQGNILGEKKRKAKWY
jgi:hypothetical protein